MDNKVIALNKTKKSSFTNTYLALEQQNHLLDLARSKGILSSSRLDILCQFFKFQHVDSQLVTNLESTGILDRLIAGYGTELSKIDKLSNFLILLGKNRFYATRLTNKEQTGFCDRLIAQSDFIHKIVPLEKALKALRTVDLKTKKLVNDDKSGILDVLIEQPTRLLEILPITIELYNSNLGSDTILKKGITNKQRKMFIEHREHYVDFDSKRGFMKKPNRENDLFALEKDLVLILSLFEKYAPNGFRYLY